MKIIKMLSQGRVKHFGQNTYLVVKNNDAILIDASVEPNEVMKNLGIFDNSPKLKAIFITHAHFDHIGALCALVEKFKCPVYTNDFGEKILKDKNKNLSTMINETIEFKDKKSLRFFKDGDEIEIGDIKVKCYLTPGHALDSSVFIIEDNMFTGDTVFKNSIGRVDMVGGDIQQIKISLNRIKDDLSEGISTFYPGHNENFDKNDLDNVIDYYLK